MRNSSRNYPLSLSENNRTAVQPQVPDQGLEVSHEIIVIVESVSPNHDQIE